MLALFPRCEQARADEADDTRAAAIAAMRRAATYYREKIAVQGGYVYHHVLNDRGEVVRRFGEGEATPSQIWVQPPGTPTVGMAYLAAHRATKERYYLDAAREAAQALIHGQLASGGWLHAIDFDPEGSRAARYRNGKGKPKGRNTSTLDDNVSQSATTFLMRLDRALDFRDKAIHESARVALDALLSAQFANGAFPQAWTGPAPAVSPAKATYPDYDWRTENRVKEYWKHYTLNDNLATDVIEALVVANEIYNDKRCSAALAKLGDFLIAAQMPDPQPAWAQQYDHEMRPAWARKFEPPAISGGESQDAIAALLTIHRHTGDAKYLEPIPRAIAYLDRSRLKDGKLARFYELKTNKPLYMTKDYELTYDDGDIPTHYGWKAGSRLDTLSRQFENAKAGIKAEPISPESRKAELARRAAAIVKELDAQGRWAAEHKGGKLVGQAKIEKGAIVVSSAVFAKNMTMLADFVIATAP